MVDENPDLETLKKEFFERFEDLAKVLYPDPQPDGVFVESAFMRWSTENAVLELFDGRYPDEVLRRLMAELDLTSHDWMDRLQP